MSYATLADLAERVPWSQLAEIAAQDTPALRGDALAAYVAAPDRAAWTPPSDGAALAEYSAAVDWLERALDDASAAVDRYLSGRYGTLSPVPETVRTATLDIALYRLLGGDTDSVRYQVWRQALRWLEGVAAGTIDLLPPTEPTAAAGDVRYSSTPALFGRDVLGQL